MIAITKDELYKRIAEMTANYQEHYLLIHDCDYVAKHQAWLCIMGLIETWDMLNGR